MDMFNVLFFLLFAGLAVRDQFVMRRVLWTLRRFEEFRKTEDSDCRNAFIMFAHENERAWHDLHVIQWFSGDKVLSWLMQLLYSGVWMSSVCLLYVVDFPDGIRQLVILVMGTLLVLSLKNYYEAIRLSREVSKRDRRFLRSES